MKIMQILQISVGLCKIILMKITINLQPLVK